MERQWSDNGATKDPPERNWSDSGATVERQWSDKGPPTRAPRVGERKKKVCTGKSQSLGSQPKLWTKPWGVFGSLPGGPGGPNGVHSQLKSIRAYQPSDPSDPGRNKTQTLNVTTAMAVRNFPKRRMRVLHCTANRNSQLGL